MLIPKNRYPGQTDTADAGYPEGKARNATTLNDGTGFPIERDWINDLLGAKQALISEAGLAPSGEPDKVGASQELDALQELFAGRTATAISLADLEAADVSLDGRLDFIEGSRGAFVYSSTDIASDLSNISAVVELRVVAHRVYGVWVGSVYALVTNSGSGTKSFRISLAGASGLDALANANDACGSGAVAFSDLVQVNGISGQEQILLTWTNSNASANATLRANFTYRH